MSMYIMCILHNIAICLHIYIIYVYIYIYILTYCISPKPGDLHVDALLISSYLLLILCTSDLAGVQWLLQSDKA
jgi:hypothetical protein